MDPVNINIFGINGLFFLWFFTIVAFYFFIRRIVKIIKVLKQAKSENRLNKPAGRIWSFAKFVLGQRKLFNDKVIGIPHFLFFWGFVFYALSFFWNLLRGNLPFIGIPYSDEIGIIGFALEIFGVLVLVSIIIAVIRRTFFPPEHLQKSIDADIILSLITILMVTLILGQSFKAGIHTTELSPVGSALSPVFAIHGKNASFAWFAAMWWIHMLTVLFFLAYIPYSKHMHLLASPFNVFFSNPEFPSNLSTEIKDAENGAATWKELTWKDLLNSFSCAECGRCDRVCPALNSGQELSPREILHHVKEILYESALKNGKSNAKIELAGKIKAEDIRQCTTCMSCMEQCPVLNEHLSLILAVRRALVINGDVEQTMQDALQKITRYGNSFGQSDRNRPKWITGLDIKIKDARKEEVEYLWLTGDYAAFDIRVQESTRKTALIFNQAGLDFGILYEAEKNSGNDVRRVGEEGLFEILKDKNLMSLNKASFKKIITTDPHTFNTLKNEYKLVSKDGTTPIPVYHYTEVINELLNQKKLTVGTMAGIIATYHDPCYLGRYNGIYDEPREILGKIGVKLTEMPRNKSKSYCCGAGGGKIWLEDKPGKHKDRPSESRIKEAAALKNVDTLVVACPKDIVMFLDAAKTTGYDDKIKILDISELVWNCISKN